jgi:uncharacterized membrane protein YtjA (UPF0391 family)
MGASFVNSIAHTFGTSIWSSGSKIGRFRLLAEELGHDATKVGADLSHCLVDRGLLRFHRYLGGEADIARVLFFIFLVIFVVLIVLGLMAGRRV